MVDGILSTGLANAPVNCSELELVTVQPVAGQTCGQYLSSFASGVSDCRGQMHRISPNIIPQTQAGSNIINPDATADCQLCPLSSTNGFLSAINASYSLRFRNFGIIVSRYAFPTMIYGNGADTSSSNVVGLYRHQHRRCFLVLLVGPSPQESWSFQEGEEGEVSREGTKSLDSAF